MKKQFILFICLFMGIFYNAQTKQLEGVVYDALSGKPLQGATVKTNTGKQTLTDSTGVFILECSDSMQITVSFTGYETSKQRSYDCNQKLSFILTANTQNLDEVEITANSNTSKKLLIQPMSIVKLGETELNRGTGLFLDDAINSNVPGVFMERRTISAGQQFNIRGYGNGVRGTNGVNSNFDTQGSKVYLNGIPITDAEGTTLMDDIDFGSINNVEVSKGPSGTLYGLAIAGVVNLQTRRAEKNKISIGENFIAGSYGLLRSTSQVAIGGKNSSVLINYGKQLYDGYMPHTASHKDFVNVMSDFTLSDKQTVTLYLGFSDSYDERNGELTIEQYDTLDYSGNQAYIKNNAHSGVVTYRAGASHIYKVSKWLSNTTTFFGSSQTSNVSSAGGWTDKTPLNYGLRSTLDMQFNISEKIKLSGITGIEMQKMNAMTTGYKMGADSTDLSGYNIIKSVSSIQSTTSATSSYFTQWSLQLPMGFIVTAGAGYSSMNLELQDRLWGLTNNHPNNTIPQSYKHKYTNMVSPFFAVNKKFGESISVYASYSTGYKAPVSSYFFIPTTGQVNTSLRPEYGTQIEIGTKGSLIKNRLFYTVALFNARFADKMTTVAVPNPSNTATLYTYITNNGSLDNKGLEMLLKYEVIGSKDKFIRSLRPWVNFTYSDFKYDGFKYEKIGKNIANKDSAMIYDYSGNSVAGVPPIVFNIGIDLETSIGFYASANYNYRDAMYFTSDERNQTSAYSLLNAKAGFRKTIKQFSFDLSVGANNITSTQYYYMVFLNQLPDAYIPAPNEINYFGNASVKYTF